MIPRNYLLDWADTAPWPEIGQIEQDLVISRALLDIFNDDLLSASLAFRGGTALNKLFFPEPFRYSEDIDLVQVEPAAIGGAIDRIRAVIEPWLGKPAIDIKENAAKVSFRFESEPDGVRRKLKIEINTREHGSFLGYQDHRFAVDSRWAAGATTIKTFAIEELLATKLRAFLQRDKGRDLFDLNQALTVFPDMDKDLVTTTFANYMERNNQQITRAMAEARLFAKLENMNALADMRALVPLDKAGLVNEQAASAAAANVMVQLLEKLPGTAWELADQNIEALGLQPYLDIVSAEIGIYKV